MHTLRLKTDPPGPAGICLVYPDQAPLPRCFDRVTNLPRNPTLLPPLGLLSVAANSRYRMDVLDNRLERLTAPRLAERLRGYELVGFGGTIFECPQAEAVSAELRRHGKLTIYGGPNATANGDRYPGKYSLIFRGETEERFDEVIAALTTDPDGVARLPGLHFERRDGTWLNREFQRITDLDRLRPPDRTLIPLARYQREERFFLPGVAPVDIVSSSRGCPFDCAFCTSCRIWGHQYTLRRVETVLAEIAALQRDHGTRGVYFREDNFTVSRPRVIEFSEKVKGLGIAWLCESRVDTLDEALLAAMRAGGCRGIWFGIETTAAATMQAIGKKLDLDQVRKITAACRALGIVTAGSFIVGFPAETADDIRRTFAESRTLGLDHAFFNRLWVIPGSALWSQLETEKIEVQRAGDILLPGTRHLSADGVTDLYYHSMYNRRVRLLKQLVPQSLVDRINRDHPGLYRLARRLTGAE